MLEYLRVAVGLIEGRRVSREEIVEMLRRAMRQRSLARERRLDYVVRTLKEEPPQVVERVVEDVELGAFDLRYEGYRMKNPALEGRRLQSIMERVLGNGARSASPPRSTSLPRRSLPPSPFPFVGSYAASWIDEAPRRHGMPCACPESTCQPCPRSRNRLRLDHNICF